MNIERVPEAWAQFQQQVGELKRPTTTDDYLQIIDLMHHISNNYGAASEPYAALFDYLATLAHEWELEHEGELKNPEVDPHRVLAYLMEEHGVSQYQLAQEGIVDQGNLSRILAGKRSISKNLAKKLAARFHVNPAVFI